MKILDRHVLKTFLGALLATTTFMIGLYLIVHFLAHVKHHEDARATFAEGGYTLLTGLCTYYMLHLPEMVVLFGPYAVLVAAMFTVHQLNQSGELVAMYAVGVTRLRMAVPLFLAAALLSALLMTIKEQAIPSLAPEMDRISRMMRGKERRVDDKVNVLRDRRGNVFTVRLWDSDRRRLVDVFMRPADAGETYEIDYLQWIEDDELGHFEPSPNQAPPGFDFETDCDLTPYDIESERTQTRRLSFVELRRLAARSPRETYIAALMYGHVTYAFTPIVLLLIGLPLVMRSRSKSVFVGIALCLVLSLAFFAVSIVLHRMGAQGEVVNPLLGAWLPLILFGGIGLVLFETVR